MSDMITLLGEYAEELARQDKEIARLTSDNEELAEVLETVGRLFAASRDALAEVNAENERLHAALDILQAAMTVKKPIPLAFKKAIIEARAALSGDKQ